MSFAEAKEELGLEARRGLKLGGYASSTTWEVERRQDTLLLQVEQERPCFDRPFLPQYGLFLLQGPSGPELVLGK